LSAKEPHGPGSAPYVFPRWTNRLRNLAPIIALGGLTYVIVLVALIFGPRATAIGYAPEQPVPYSHALHVGELGLDCRYCHNTVEGSAHAAIPPARTCMNCHATVKAESELLAPIRASFETGEPVAWVRVHDLPDFVYFDHSAHLNAGVGCSTCHGRVDRMEVVSQQEALTMGWCLDCHRNPAPHLRPRRAITNATWIPEHEPELVQHSLVEEYDVTPSTSCSTCHR
jgi:hypothetical protein